MSSTAIGNALEETIYRFFCDEIAASRFFAKKANCKVFRRKAYYSRDRKANIVFDVSIEIYLSLPALPHDNKAFLRSLLPLPLVPA